MSARCQYPWVPPQISRKWMTPMSPISSSWISISSLLPDGVVPRYHHTSGIRNTSPSAPRGAAAFPRGPSFPGRIPGGPGAGTAFSVPKIKRRCTLIVAWYAEQEEPWVILTDLPPEEAGASWYALRFWIEVGFKALKSLEWQWQKTRRTDPARISRHWLVLSVATLLALAYGTRVEDVYDQRIAPRSLRAPPKALASTHRSSWSRPGRTVSVIRHGIIWLRRLLHRGRSWSRVWLLPEPWPEPKSNLEVTRHAPA